MVVGDGTMCSSSPLCHCMDVSPCTFGGKFRNPPSPRPTMARAEARVRALVGSERDGFPSSCVCDTAVLFTEPSMLQR